MRISATALALALSGVPLGAAFSTVTQYDSVFTRSVAIQSTIQQLAVSSSRHSFRLQATSEETSKDDSMPTAPPPMFNGKRVLPGAIVMTGLKASSNRVPAVYAVLSPDYKKNKGEGWESVIQVAVTQDLSATLQAWESSQKSKIAFVRALSFVFPEPNTMQDMANEWKQLAQDAGASLMEWSDPSVYLFDDDEDDDEDDEDDWDMDMTAQAMASVSSPKESPVVEEVMDSSDSPSQTEEEVISPFAATATATASSDEDGAELPFTVEAIDKVLDEVRPYLIADGGNVAVVDADAETQVVSLELQGACGSCASSTVTMQMGIERVLKENYGPQVSVQQVESGEDVPKSLSYQAVEDEVARLSPAVVAMGGVVRIVSVEEETGVVQLFFRGANKVRQGLELALRDVAFVNAVQFVSEDGEQEEE